jgi:hypothetical protein
VGQPRRSPDRNRGARPLSPDCFRPRAPVAGRGCHTAGPRLRALTRMDDGATPNPRPVGSTR